MNNEQENNLKPIEGNVTADTGKEVLPAEKPATEPLQVTIVPRKRKWWPWVLALALAALIGLILYTIGKRRGIVEGHGVVADSAYSVDGDTVDGWATQADYEHWRNAIFVIPQYDAIPEPFKKGIVKIFMDNHYVGDSLNKDGTYFLTRIKDRAPKVFKFGHFTGSGDREMAFLLEKNDYKSSALFIISERGDLLYYKQLDFDLPILGVIKEGEPVYLGDISVKKAANDVVKLIKGTKGTYAIVYDPQTKTFEQYYQYPPEEIKAIMYEREHGDGEEEPDSTEVDTAAKAQE